MHWWVWFADAALGCQPGSYPTTQCVASAGLCFECLLGWPVSQHVRCLGFSLSGPAGVCARFGWSACFLSGSRVARAPSKGGRCSSRPGPTGAHHSWARAGGCRPFRRHWNGLSARTEGGGICNHGVVGYHACLTSTAPGVSTQEGSGSIPDGCSKGKGLLRARQHARSSQPSTD